ncbi:YfmQ family protein [Peribacillus glennii]|uniref:YfmQ family protein n=1 Tax=Peribacillus glennii TaxID=2303991 RepID=A0A372L651_9BACI|nr:YfmQ family protein [Peribacillus glennii]RFU60454.1 hypothetical protein D0466_21655 [Peribacillus glennii]
MTWIVAISIAIGCIIKFSMNPPSAVVAWISSKFALHAQLNSKDITVSYNGTHLEEEEKIRFTDYFNEAIFLKKYYIFPGNEKLFLHPETNVIPYVIKVKGRKKDVDIFVYSYDDHVDVVKQCKKKVVSYSLRSDYLQTITISTKGFSAKTV